MRFHLLRCGKFYSFYGSAKLQPHPPAGEG